MDGRPGAARVFRTAPIIFIPFVVIAELRAGFAVGSRGGENQRVFERFLHRPRVEVLLPTVETTRRYATLYRQLRIAGTPILAGDG